MLMALAAVAAGGLLLAFAVLAFIPSRTDADELDAPYVPAAVEEGGRKPRKPPLAERLARSGLRLRASEFRMLQAGCAAAVGLLCLLRFGIGLVPAIGALVGLALPGFYLKLRAGRRLKRFNSQLVDVLSLMGGSLKAGHALPQTLELISTNMRPPMGEEFARCVREMQVGGSIDAALINLARRSGSVDMELVVTAMLVQINVGGNLAGTLERISYTIRERIRIHAEVAAATAQGRISSWVVTGLPVGVAGLLFVISPTYFRPMTQQPLGWLMLGGAGFLILIGNLVIRKVVSVEI
jgi:tight adherence protein B